MKINKLYKNKKADGMTFNIIVTAEIALVVMIVIIVIFSGRIGDVSDFYSKCEKAGVGSKEHTCNDPKVVCECEDGKMEYLPLRKIEKGSDGRDITHICCVDRFA